MDVDDLIDANEVAAILGLSRAGAVSVYQSRYLDMPRPVYERGPSRAKLWLRSEMTDWHQQRSAPND